jgi:hypothetical protein
MCDATNRHHVAMIKSGPLDSDLFIYGLGDSKNGDYTRNSANFLMLYIFKKDFEPIDGCSQRVNHVKIRYD